MEQRKYRIKLDLKLEAFEFLIRIPSAADGGVGRRPLQEAGVVVDRGVSVPSPELCRLLDLILDQIGSTSEWKLVKSGPE